MALATPALLQLRKAPQAPSLRVSRSAQAPACVSAFARRHALRVSAAAAGGERYGTTLTDDDRVVGPIPTGEWEQNFSILNYQDLQGHYESEDEKMAMAGVPPSPLVADESHGVVSSEWSMNLSILSYDDLMKHFQEQLFKSSARPDSVVAEVMVRDVRVAGVDQRVSDILHHFQHAHGLPVVDASHKCVGMLTLADVEQVKSADVAVRDIMAPAKVVMRPNKSVLFAATLMLKNKVDRIPIVNENDQVVGIVSRTDIFTVLESSG